MVLCVTDSEQCLPSTATVIGGVSCRLAAVMVCCVLQTVNSAYPPQLVIRGVSCRLATDTVCCFVLQAVNSAYPTQPVVEQLHALGMCPTGLPLPVAMSQCYSVLLDGQLVGYLPDHIAADAAKQLRALKVMGLQQVSVHCVSVSLCVRLSMCQSLCVSICTSLSPCVSHSVCQSLCAFMCLSVCLHLCLWVYACVSVHSICLHFRGVDGDVLEV